MADTPDFKLGSINDDGGSLLNFFTSLKSLNKLPESFQTAPEAQHNINMGTIPKHLIEEVRTEDNAAHYEQQPQSKEGINIKSDNKPEGTLDKEYFGADGQLIHLPVNTIEANAQNAKFIDITEFLCMPQSDAAKKLGLPVSTLSKRWKEAVRERKWPFRKVSKLDKEITTLLHNIPNSGPEAGKMSSDVEQKLAKLLRKRQEELKPVIIRL